MTQENSTERTEGIKNIHPFFGKKLLALIIVIAVVIFLPILFFVISPSRENKITVEKIFYPNAPYVEEQLIVKYKDKYTLDEINNLKSALERVGVTSQRKVFNSDSLELRNFYVLSFKKGTDLKKVAEEIANLPEIEALAPNYISKTQVNPNDQLFNEQWDLEKINMPQAWDINKGSNNITVAVIDSGIDYTHKDFIGRTIIKGPDYVRCAKLTVVNGEYRCTPKAPDDDPMDDYGHGTHVAGTIGAVTNNNYGIAGAAWNVTLMAVKTMNAEGDGDDESISRGIWYAADNGADIINLSIANYIPCSSSPAYKAAIKHALDKNIVVIAAAGNKPIDAKGVTPASCDGVITVASTDKNDQRASSSGWGSKVKIAAPGIGILSLVPGNKFLPLSGTSMAAPHVAGVAALLLSQRPLMSLSEVEDCLVNNADSISTDKPIGPRLNAFKSLNACSGQPLVTPTPVVAATPTQSAQLPTSSAPNQSITSIQGLVYIDKNNNKLWESGERGYAGAHISLVGQQNISRATDSSGEYSFNDLQPGNYKVNLLINGELIGYSPDLKLSKGVRLNVYFPLSSAFDVSNSAPQATPTKAASPTAKKTPAPTSQKTYSCHMKTLNPKQGSIQIGDLECTPN